ncbi:N-acetylglutamate synthase, GNAT family [Paenibacillaceae bacterium GAS479]|nr:N-acetylglutamate synthase, GNAT family [Paenibacillaceae bacterium GAS479]
MIREAESKDAYALEDLYKALAPNSNNIKVMPERIKQIMDDLNNFLFVFEQNEILIGTIFVTICLDPMYEYRPYAVVENIIVDKDLRGTGIGKKLLEYVEQLCISKGCTKIMLFSNANRIEAHEFFMNNGYSGSVSKGFKKYIPISASNNGTL